MSAFEKWWESEGKRVWPDIISESQLSAIQLAFVSGEQAALQRQKAALEEGWGDEMQSR